MPDHEHGGLLTDEALLHNIAHGCEDCFDVLFLQHPTWGDRVRPTPGAEGTALTALGVNRPKKLLRGG